MMVWNMLLEREMDTQLKGEERTGEWNLLGQLLARGCTTKVD